MKSYDVFEKLENNSTKSDTCYIPSVVQKAAVRACRRLSDCFVSTYDEI